MWYIYTVEYYKFVKKKCNHKTAGKWAEGENVILSKVAVLCVCCGEGHLGTSYRLACRQAVGASSWLVIDGRL